LIVCNFANADMVGHTGHFTASIQAVEYLDQCLAKIGAAVLDMGGDMLITADHGNVEYLFDECTQQPHTAHTQAPVPFLYVGSQALLRSRTTRGSLADIAPTILCLMGLPQPVEMTGAPLLELIVYNNQNLKET
jgi:2,3-bisphosphoglycerate-independent phosphoglycerate mutase